MIVRFSTIFNNLEIAYIENLRIILDKVKFNGEVYTTQK